MRVIAVSGCPAVPFWNHGDEARQRLFAFALIDRIHQLGRSEAAPTVVPKNKIIFEITCVFLYYRRRRDESKEKVGDSEPVSISGILAPTMTALRTPL